MEGSFGARLPASCEGGRSSSMSRKTVTGGVLALILVLLGVLGWRLYRRSVEPGLFLRAAANGDTARVRTLLDDGVNVNTRDVHGMTALQSAAMNGHTSTVRLLLQKGADPQGYDEALRAAALNCHPAIVQLLLFQGLHPHAVLNKDKEGHTTLWHIAQKQKNPALSSACAQTLALLRKAGVKE
jgi:ankyrin repeat protein